MDLALDATKRPTRRLARILAPLAQEYDYIVLDCPPSVSLVSESVIEAADALLVPIVPATLSSRTFEQLAALVSERTRNDPLVLGFFSMVDGRKRLHREVMQELAANPGVLKAAIPAVSDVERMGLLRAPVAEFAPRSRAALAYQELWREVRNRLA
jgi:cellulose biosynthesis protein BcsQ